MEPAPERAAWTRSLWRARLRRLLPVLWMVLFVGALYVISRELRAVSWDAFWESLRQLTPLRLTGALACTVISYATLIGFDAVALRYAGGRVSRRRVMLGGFVASAVGNVTGNATLIGGAVRLRLYADAGLSPAGMAQVVVFCALPFWLGLSVSGGLTLLMVPAPEAGAFAYGVAGPALGVVLLGLVLVYALWSLRGRVLRIRGRTLDPPGALGLAQIVLGTADVLAFAGALVFLLPETGASAVALIGVVLVALVGGMFSGVPAGLGVFEAIVLAMLPTAPRPDLLAALVTFRTLYYLVPAALAAVLMLLHEGRQVAARRPERGAHRPA